MGDSARTGAGLPLPGLARLGPALSLLLLPPLAAAPSDFLEFLGAAAYAQHEVVLGAEMGGISGLSYHAASAEWYAISDRGGRFYRFTLQQEE